MGADKSAKNAQKFICPSSKVWDFDEKKASMGVREPEHLELSILTDL